MRRLGGLLLLIAMAAAYASYTKLGDVPTSSPRPTVIPKFEPPHPPSIRVLTVDRSGSVAAARFEISNEFEYPIKDIGIACEFVGKSGSVVNRRSVTAYEIVKPKSKLTTKLTLGFIDEQVIRVSCEALTASKA